MNRWRELPDDEFRHELSRLVGTLRQMVIEDHKANVTYRPMPAHVRESIRHGQIQARIRSMTSQQPAR